MKMNDLIKMGAHIGRRLSGKQSMAPRVNLRGKKIIITGASPKSIGFESALTLAEWGAEVIITGRSNTQETAKILTLALKEKGAAGLIDSHDLELGDYHSVSRFAEWYLQKHGDRLDILMNNAGIHLDLMSQWSEPKLSDDGIEIHWRINYLGNAQLTHLLLPLLKATGTKFGEARVINIASQLHDKGINKAFFDHTTPYNSWQAYGQSKLGLIHTAFEIDRRFAKPFNLKAYAVHPGSVFTNIADKGLDGNVLIQGIRHFFAPIEAFFLLNPKEGAQTQILCASSNITSRRYYERCQPGQLNPEANDPACAQKLWQQTESWLNTHPLK